MVLKLFENIEELGNSMEAAIKNMVDEMFGKELRDTEIANIVSNLKLSDLLVLDTAYTQGDNERVARILGLKELVEYSMGHTATSAASNRPMPGRKDAPQKSDDAASPKNTTQTNRNYSGGAQNAVTTTNIDSEDDNPDAMVQDDEPIEESSNSDKKYFAAVARQLGVLMGSKGTITHFDLGEYGRAMTFQIGDDTIDIWHEWKYNGSKGKPDTVIQFNGDEEELGRFAIWWGKPADYAKDLYSVIEDMKLYYDESVTEDSSTAHKINVVEMKEWLQRKAGITK